VRFNVVSLEHIVRAEVPFISVLAGTLRDSVVQTVAELAPELAKYKRKRLSEMGPVPLDEPPDHPTGSRDTKGRFLPTWRRKRDAQSLAEYALMLALIAIVAIAAIAWIGSAVSVQLSDIGNSI
jgi:Flp pilus assembly pilin Flp